jgi:uncharacterized membrane protein
MRLAHSIRILINRHSRRSSANPNGRRRATLSVEALERRDLFAVSITNLGTYHGLPLTPTGINDQGQVVGYAGSSTPAAPAGPITAFLFTPGKGPVTLEPDAANPKAVEALRINDAGQIVGWYGDKNGLVHAVLWNKDGTSPTTLPGSAPSGALDINAAGEIVGTSNFSTDNTPAVHGADWASAASEPTDMGAGLPTAINAAGDVVGAAPVAGTSNSQPVFVPDIGNGINLPLPVGTTTGSAMNLNNEGEVIGYSTNLGSQGFTAPTAVLWKLDPKTHNYAGSTIMGSFMPLAINDNGIVVGYEGGTGTGQLPTAVVWTSESGMVTLNDLVPASYGWSFETASDISDRNVFVGKGVFHGQEAGYTLVGVPSLPKTPQVSLNVQLGDAGIVPLLAPKQHLSQFYGGEKVRVPVIVKNTGETAAEGTVQLSLSLNSQPPAYLLIPWAVRTEPIHLEPDEQVVFEFTLTVPKTKLTVDEHYNVAVAMGSANLNTDPDADVGDTRYDYIGQPAAGFSSSAYFQTIRAVIAGTPLVSGVNMSDPQSFIGHWEGDSLWPYKNAQGVPMIGVGVNLKTVSGQTKSYLSAIVRYYYQTTYHKQLGDDDAVIAMLNSQARRVDPRHPDVHAPQAMTTSDDQALFNVSNTANSALAAQETGPAWYYLNQVELTALVDSVYRLGRVPASVAAALNEPSGKDFVQAGFAIFNAVRPKSRTDLLRVEAEYQDLLSAHVPQLS